MDNNGFGEAFAIQIAFFFRVSLIHEPLFFFQTRFFSIITRQMIKTSDELSVSEAIKSMCEIIPKKRMMKRVEIQGIRG